MADDGKREAIRAELSRIEENAKHSAQSQFEQAKIWRTLHWFLGLPAAGLAAAAGGSLLADAIGTTTAAVLALASAVLGAVVTTLNASQHGEQCQTAANEYLALQDAARVAREVDLPALELEEAREGLASLLKRRTEINQAAPSPSFVAYWKGRRNIEKGRQDYAVDRPR